MLSHASMLLLAEVQTTASMSTYSARSILVLRLGNPSSKILANIQQYVEHPKNTYSVPALRVSSNSVPSPLGCIDNRWYTRFLLVSTRTGASLRLRISENAHKYIEDRRQKNRKVHRANSFFPHSNDVARGGGFILDSCVQAGYDRVEGSEFAYGSGHELVRLRRP